MENTIKMESEYRLENLFVSVTLDTLDVLVEIAKTPELDVVTRGDINKFVYITKQTNKIPTIDTLKKEFPSMYFDSVTTISHDELEDYSRIYISIVKNQYTASRLMELATYVKSNGIDESAVNKLNSLSKSETVSIEHVDIRDNLLEIYKNKVDMDGIKTGVTEVDKDTGGLHKGTLNTILGFTGSFKTTWATNIAYNAISEGKNVLYLSLEVTKEHIHYSLMSRHSFDTKFTKHIEHLELKHKSLSDTDFRFLEKTLYPDYLKIPGRVFVVDETELEAYSFYALENKFREIEKLAVEETGKGIDLLVIDHAQLLKFDASMKSVGNETSVINAYVSFFRQNALNWIKSGKQISVLMLSQSSREGWKEAVRSEGRYRLTALAEANELERASSLVLSVFSSDSLKQVKAAKVQILKNRDGQVWSEPMEVFVEPAYCTFGDIQGGVSTNQNFSFDNLNSLFNMDDESLNSISSITDDINYMDLGV